MTRWRFLLVLSSLALGGCGHRAIDFNNQVAAIHARLGTAVEQFARTLRPAVDEGRAPSADQLADAAERLRGEVAAAEERSGQLRVPDLPQAGELYAAHQEFLTWQRNRLEEELRAIERLIHADDLNAQSASKGLSRRIASMRQREQLLLPALHASQRRFAEANGLKLQEVPAD